ncbi:MAG: putative Fe-S cluster assembly protein SufT [Pseudomonadota bacterium]|nr:putative Fe-S cluster assembly protein SufT [Pseudomonadota bacterium]
MIKMNDLKGTTVTLSRDVDAILIPDAYPVNLVCDTEVYISQALGTSYTVIADGKMLRICAEDADALGEEFVKALADSMPELKGTIKEQAWQLLATCYDPEIPVSIVDLGLVYALNLLEIGESDKKRIHIVMTLTAPSCGMGPILVEEIKQKLQVIVGVQDVVVELVFDPPWTQDLMSEAAKLTLGVF